MLDGKEQRRNPLLLEIASRSWTGWRNQHLVMRPLFRIIKAVQSWHRSSMGLDHSD